MRFMTRLLKEAGVLHILADTLASFDSALLDTQRPKRFQFPGKITVILAHGTITISHEAI